MRTSASQFSAMVQFMEKHGDLSKHVQNEGLQGKLDNIIKWTQLTTELNADPLGAPKTDMKWKKVWSDFKNNTKKKACSKKILTDKKTGRKLVIKKKLSDLEERVMDIINAQVPTENYSPYEQCPEQDKEDPLSQPIEVKPETSLLTEYSQESRTIESYSDPQPPISPQPSTTSLRQEYPRSPIGPSMRRRLVTNSNYTSRAILYSDRKWREFYIERERREYELERERLRLRAIELQHREMELQNQARWQTVLSQFVSIIEKASNKYFDGKT